MTKELKEYAIDIIKNHSHRLVKNFTETDLINRELTIFNTGYKKGYKDGRGNNWHILIENPDDVPCENQIVKVITEDGEIRESQYYWDDYYEEMAFSMIGLVKVIAWKEFVPTKLEG